MTQTWTLAGQSNMEGCAPLADDLPRCPQAEMLSFDGTWKPAVDPLHRLMESRDSWHYRFRRLQYPDLDTYQEQGLALPGALVGPGTAFADELHRLTGERVRLLPCALGGSPIAMWDKAWCYPDGGFGEGDNLFFNMIKRARTAGSVSGVLWYQGESDATPDRPGDYEQRLRALVADVRAFLGAPALPFVVVQLANVPGWDPACDEGWAEVREAQRRVAASTEGVSIVAAADLSTFDGLHLDTASQVALGRRLARAAAGSPTPNLERVVIERSRRVLRVQASGVNGSLRGSSPDFFVGRSRVAACAVARSSEVVVSLARPYQPGEGVSYGAGRLGRAAIVDDAGFPLPFFGPVEPEAAP